MKKIIEWFKEWSKSDWSAFLCNPRKLKKVVIIDRFKIKESSTYSLLIGYDLDIAEEDDFHYTVIIPKEKRSLLGKKLMKIRKKYCHIRYKRHVYTNDI